MNKPHIPMITSIIPKLPFIDKQRTIEFYTQLGFQLDADYGNYLILLTEVTELHFFHHPKLRPAASHFMIYLRMNNGIEHFYENLLNQHIPILTALENKPWGQAEFALTDPNGTLLTFGQALTN